MILLCRRRWGLLYLPVLAMAGLAIWTLAHTLLTLPPRTLALERTDGSELQPSTHLRSGRARGPTSRVIQPLERTHQA